MLPLEVGNGGASDDSDSSQSDETSQESNDLPNLAKPKDVIGTIVQLKKIADVIGTVGQKVIPAIIDSQPPKSILPTDGSAITPLKFLQSIKQNNE